MINIKIIKTNASDHLNITDAVNSSDQRNDKATVTASHHHNVIGRCCAFQQCAMTLSHEIGFSNVPFETDNLIVYND